MIHGYCTSVQDSPSILPEHLPINWPTTLPPPAPRAAVPPATLLLLLLGSRHAEGLLAVEPLLLKTRPGAADVRDRLVVVIVLVLFVVQAAHDLLEPEPRRGEGLLWWSAVIVSVWASRFLREKWPELMMRKRDRLVGNLYTKTRVECKSERRSTYGTTALCVHHQQLRVVEHRLGPVAPLRLGEGLLGLSVVVIC